MQIDPDACPAVQIGFTNALACGPRPAGVGRYVEGLLLGLDRLGLAGRVTLVTRPDARLPPSACRRVQPGRSIRLRPLRLVWEQVGLPRLVRRLNLDLLHGAMHVLPLRLRQPGVVTVHDMTFELRPELHERSKATYFRSLTRLSLERARRVVVVSEATRQDVLRLTDLGPSRVRVIPNAVHPRFRQAMDPKRIEAVLARYGVTRPYLLSVAVIEPRKNLPRLLEAWARLGKRGLELPLVLVGRSAWGRAALERAFSSHPRLASAVRLTGYVPDDELPCLMQAAEALVYPSLYEGFGLPVAEALACGTPVITSRVSSLPEVAGDAAVYVDPESVDSIAAGIERMVDDAELRARLADRGLEQARRFTPERLAEATFQTWLEVLGETS